MCFSNFPVEFDEHGDPYLAEEADAVDRPACGCGEAEVSLAEDPTEAYEALLRTLGPDVQALLEGEPEPSPPDAAARGD